MSRKLSPRAKKIKQLILDESQSKALIKSKERQTELGEVFTPSDLVFDMLTELPKETWQEGRTFLDPTCGNGQFLAAILITKIQLGHKNPLATIYGVDIMKDNCAQCRARLFAIARKGKHEKTLKQYEAILKKHIVCADGLEYDYSFDEKEQMELDKKCEEDVKWMKETENKEN